MTSIAEILSRGQSRPMGVGAKVASALNSAGEAMTFGLVGDEAAARFDSLIGRGSYDDRVEFYRRQQEQLREEAPRLALVSEIGGAMILPGANLARAGGLARRAATSAAVGAGGGATYGFMEGEGGLDPRIKNAQTVGTIGGVIGGAIPVVGRAAQKAIGAVQGNRAVANAAQDAPSTEALRAQGDAAYRAVDDAGVQVTPQAWQRLTQEITDTAQGMGMDLTPGNPNTPRAAYNVNRAGQMVDEMAAQAPNNPGLPFRSIDQYRRSLNTAAGDFTNKQEQAIATAMIQRIDDFVANLSPGDTLTGDAAALKGALTTARELWGRMRRSELLDQAAENAENYVSGPASGLRNQFGSILRNKKLARQFSDAEKAAMRRVVNGTFPERLMHLMGGGMGQHFSSLMGAVTGAATAGPVGGIAGFVGAQGVNAAARNVSENIATRNAQRARDAVASGQLRQAQIVPDSTREQIEQLLRRAIQRPAIVSN